MRLDLCALLKELIDRGNEISFSDLPNENTKTYAINFGVFTRHLDLNDIIMREFFPNKAKITFRRLPTVNTDQTTTVLSLRFSSSEHVSDKYLKPEGCTAKLWEIEL